MSSYLCAYCDHPLESHTSTKCLHDLDCACLAYVMPPAPYPAAIGTEIVLSLDDWEDDVPPMGNLGDRGEETP